MFSDNPLEEEPIINKAIPRMIKADTSIPKPTTSDPLLKEKNYNKNLCIQTEVLNTNCKSFDLKKYLNRNSPKYYNLKEKLQTFQSSVKVKKPQVKLPSRPSIERSAHKNTQSTIDQTPQPQEKRKNSIKNNEENEDDYENNFIIAKVNNFFQNSNKKAANLSRTPNKRKEGSLEIEDKNLDRYKKPVVRNKGKEIERPKTAFPKRTPSPKTLEKKSFDSKITNNEKRLKSNHLLSLTEGIEEGEDLHNRYEKEINLLFGKEIVSSTKAEKKVTNKKKIPPFSSSLPKQSDINSKNQKPHKISLEKTEQQAKKKIIKPEKTIVKKPTPPPVKQKQHENPQIPAVEMENNIDIENVKTREKKKTLEKFITQINRGI